MNFTKWQELNNNASFEEFEKVCNLLHDLNEMDPILPINQQEFNDYLEKNKNSNKTELELLDEFIVETEKLISKK